MQEKPFRVINALGVSWGMRFSSEEAAWGRLLALKGNLPDTRENRKRFIDEGWQIIDTEELNGGL